MMPVPRETTKEGRAASKGGLPTKAHVWVSARDGELSDWGPYSGTLGAIMLVVAFVGSVKGSI